MNSSNDGREPDEYPVYVQRAPDGQAGFMAEAPDLPGCFGLGPTHAAALEACMESRRTWLVRAAELGIVPPKPGTSSGNLGSIRVRVSRTLHRDLAILSNNKNLSLNEVATRLLYRAVSRDFGSHSFLNLGICAFSGLKRPGRRPRTPRYDVSRKYTGSWLQRVPRELHLQLTSWADTENVSLNLLVAMILVRELERLNQSPAEQSKQAIVA